MNNTSLAFLVIANVYFAQDGGHHFVLGVIWLILSAVAIGASK